MTISIVQFPGSEENLLKAILELLADQEVMESYAVVAFATLDGFILLGPQPEGHLHRFLERGGRVDWVFGVDAVTTAPALQLMRDLAGSYPRQVSARVFQSQRGGLFHPKLYIFTTRSGGGTVLVGSNNLTRGGLQRNTELAVRLDLGSDDIAIWIAVFTRLTSVPSAVHVITDAIIEQVAEQRRREVRLARSTGTIVVETEDQPESVASGPRILLQTVPHSEPRLSQLGVTARTMTEFFGFRPGVERSVRLQQVQPGGAPQQIEVRPLVLSLTNRNRRIEVAGIAHITYPPPPDRPILIFQESSEDFYRYLVLLPGDPGYGEIRDYLATVPRRGLSLPHDIVELEQLLGIWPDYPR